MLKRNPFQSSIETVLKGPRFKHGPVKRVACDRIASTTSERKVLELLNTLADQILSGSYNGKSILVDFAPWVCFLALSFNNHSLIVSWKNLSMLMLYSHFLMS